MLPIKAAKGRTTSRHFGGNQRRYQKRKRNKFNKKIGMSVILIMMLLGLVAICWKTDQESGIFTSAYVNINEIPDFMQFTYYSKEEWQEKLGIGTDEHLTEGHLTYGHLAELLDLLQLQEYVKYEDKKAATEVERDTWNTIYEQIVELLDIAEKVQKKSILYIEGETEEAKLTIITEDGTYTYPADQLNLEQYQSYDVYLMDEQILGFARENQEESVIANVYVTEQKEELKFIFQNKQRELPLETTEDLVQTICDIHIKNGAIIKIQKKEDYIQGKLLAIRKKKIDIEGYGAIERVKDLPVYQTYGETEQKSLSDIVIGNMNLHYVVAEKKICAIILTEPAEIKTVRVLLLNENSGICRPEVYLCADEAYQVSIGETVEDREAGSIVRASDYFTDEEEQSVKAEVPDGGSMYFCDESGAKISNPYEGSLEIRKYDDGYAVVNAISLESYLCGVVPSEMPATYGIEALKAQAVCARSYAYIQLMNGDYADYGAHIDDSTNYQVYNKQEHQETTTQAVHETEGQVITNQDKTVEAYYYSTSFGHSGSYESWNLEDDGTLDYLQGTWLKDKAKKLDLSDETVFAAYINEADDECYDSFAKYFRWRAKLNLTDKSEQIKEKINARKSAQPNSIIIHHKDNDDAENTYELGIIKSFVIQERNSCGGIKKLIVNFENGTVDIADEYSIRIIIGTTITTVTWQDESESTDMTVLPSSYFTINSTENGEYIISGGGYGHGIGMSQNGAKGMADKGYGYEEILQKFYPGVIVKNIYLDDNEKEKA